jgi:hypothetical protein
MKQYHPVSRLAIYLLSAVLIVLGIYYLTHPIELFVFVPEWLIGGVYWAYLLGGAYILVGVSFITNQFVKFSGYTMVVLLFIFIVAIHIPNWLNSGDKEYRFFAFINVLKDTAIAAFALHLSAGAHHQHLHFEESD